MASLMMVFMMMLMMITMMIIIMMMMLMKMFIIAIDMVRIQILHHHQATLLIPFCNPIFQQIETVFPSPKTIILISPIDNDDRNYHGTDDYGDFTSGKVECPASSF